MPGKGVVKAAHKKQRHAAAEGNRAGNIAINLIYKVMVFEPCSQREKDRQGNGNAIKSKQYHAFFPAFKRKKPCQHDFESILAHRYMPRDLLLTLSQTIRSVLMPTFKIQNNTLQNLKIRRLFSLIQGDILYTTQPILPVPICTG